MKIPVVHLQCLRAYYEEKTKTEADVAEDAVVASPAVHSPPQSPQSPLDSIVLDSPRSPTSASVHNPSPIGQGWQDSERETHGEKMGGQRGGQN